MILQRHELDVWCAQLMFQQRRQWGWQLWCGKSDKEIDLLDAKDRIVGTVGTAVETCSHAAVRTRRVTSQLQIWVIVVQHPGVGCVRAANAALS